MRVTTASRKRRSWETTRTAPVEAGEELLEPGEAVGVEVVGGLVEEQDVGVLEQRGGQQRAGLLAAGEAPQRAGGVEVVDGEAAADLLGARLGRPRAGGLGAVEGVGVGIEVVRAAGARRAPGRPRRGRRGAASSSVASGASCGR